MSIDIGLHTKKIAVILSLFVLVSLVLIYQNKIGTAVQNIVSFIPTFNKDNAHTISDTRGSKDVVIAYFLGGRTSLLYRAYMHQEFENENISVKLITHTLNNNNDYYIIPKEYSEIEATKGIAKATGGELLEKMINGEADGATPGESSFISGVAQGMPMVAVAKLGYDTKDKPGHAIIFRTGVSIEKPDDIKEKVLVSRRAGAGDAIFLREFLESENISEKDVIIKDQLDDFEYRDQIISGESDGGYFHLTQLADIVDRGQAYIYRRFDWVNPELSQALLVFHKDFVKDHPDKVEHLVRAYMKRIKFEHSLSKEERIIDPDKNFRSGLQMEMDFHGMNIPQYDLPPTVSLDLLNEMQDLMLKYNYIDKKADLREYIDNSFVEKIYRDGNY